jgi:hypothetical protein
MGGSSEAAAKVPGDPARPLNAGARPGQRTRHSCDQENRLIRAYQNVPPNGTNCGQQRSFGRSFRAGPFGGVLERLVEIATLAPSSLRIPWVRFRNREISKATHGLACANRRGAAF